MNLLNHNGFRAHLRGEGAGRFRLEGEVTFSTVMHLLHESRSLFENESIVRLDMSAVDKFDSAGLALAVEWLREFAQGGRKLEIRNPPERLLALARISDVERLLKPLIVADTMATPNTGAPAS